MTQAPAEGVDPLVLDLMLPGIDGLEVWLRLRTRDDDLPVVMLATTAAAVDPARELVVRVDSDVPRLQESRSASLRDGDLVVDPTEHTATLAGRRLSLTGREFDLLRFLVSHPGEAFSRDELLQHVWGWSFGDQSTVTVHVRRLREKVEADPSRPERLATVWGVGYRWDAAC